MLKIDWKLVKLIAETVLIWVGVAIILLAYLTVVVTVVFTIGHFVVKYW